MANAFASRAKEWEFESLIPHHFYFYSIKSFLLLFFRYFRINHAGFGFLEKIFATAVMVHKTTTIHIGVFSFFASATMGAKMVTNLHTKLQMPSEVAVKSVGNRAALPK